MQLRFRKNVSLFGAWFTLEDNQEYVRGIYVRHSAPTEQKIIIYSNETKKYGSSENIVEPNVWKFIKTNTIKGSGNFSALIMVASLPSYSLDYKKKKRYWLKEINWEMIGRLLLTMSKMK